MMLVGVINAGTEEEEGGVNELVEQIAPDSECANTFDRKLTSAMQGGMLYLSMGPMTFHLLRSYVAARLPRMNILSRLLNIFAHFMMFLFVLGISVGLLVQLRFNDKPPQFFDPDSNIQKMLDLAGNVTDSSAVNCYNCSAWNSNMHCEFVVCEFVYVCVYVSFCMSVCL